MAFSLRQWKDFLSPEAYEQLKIKYEKSISSGAANPPTNVEPTPCPKPLGEKKSARFNSPVCISIHSVRKKLADPDGVSAKAAIDGLVKEGILKDDRQENIANISFSQEKGEPERTIITIKEIE